MSGTPLLAVGFLAPWWLVGLAAIPLVVLGIRARGATRVPLHAAIRSLVFAALLLGLARPYFIGADDREYAVYVVDLSQSVDSQDQARVLAAMRDAERELPSNVEARLIVFGGATGMAALPSFERVHSEAASSLATALDAAVRSIPRGARGSVTILSDGRATDARHGDALITLQEREIPVHTIELASAPVEPHVATIDAADELRVGIESEIAVELVGTARTASVELRVGATTIGRAEVTLVDERGSARFHYEPREAGFVALEAWVGEHSLRRTFAVQDPLRALYVGKRMVGGDSGLSELLGPGLQIVAPGSGDDGARAVTPADLERCDLVLIDDAPAESFAEPFASALVEAVTQRGLGLFACGGESAFGAGGWVESPIAGILPVEARQSEEKRDPSTTLVLIIDTSGSMGGERIQLAKEVARLAMSRLLPHDKVGIVEFYGAKRWAAPIQPASNTIDLARAINRMDAGGGTVILPAIEEAFYGMQNVQTRYKHVLVLTDGGVESGSFEPLLRRMAEEGINVSTVLIGPEAHSEFLVDIANWGKGRFYSVPDRFNLPEVLFKQPTSSRLPAYRPGSFPLRTRGGMGWWGSVERSAIPPLAGYIETAARPGSEVLIEIEESRAPVLATWSFGLGRVTTFTTEPVGPGAASWREWGGYGAFLARVLERTANERRVSYAFEMQRRGSEIEITARRRLPTAEPPFARTLDTTGTPLAEVTFERRADGLYRAQFLADPNADVRVLAGTANASSPSTRLITNARADERAETSVSRGEALDLARVAAATGGDRTSLESLARSAPRAGGPAKPQRVRELAWAAFLVALLGYLFEIFHRRRDRGVLGDAR